MTSIAWAMTAVVLLAAPPPARPVEPNAVTPAAESAPPPPPSASPEGEAETEAPAEPTAPRRFRFGGGVSGVVVPPLDSPTATWAVGAEFNMMVAFNQRFDLLVLLNFTHAEADATVTNALLAGVGGEVWFGFYGLGALTGLGYAKFDKVKHGGWDDDSAAILLLGSPARFRFGERVQHHIFLDLGTIVFLAHYPELFGRIGYSILF
ncbi:MAG: hypothetical protein QM723_27395 [Myxococcaceae bacterium]